MMLVSDLLLLVNESRFRWGAFGIRRHRLERCKRLLLPLRRLVRLLRKTANESSDSPPPSRPPPFLVAVMRWLVGGGVLARKPKPRLLLRDLQMKVSPSKRSLSLTRYGVVHSWKIFRVE